MNNYLGDLYEQVKHGDEDHQKWLKDKFEEFDKEFPLTDHDVIQYLFENNGTEYNLHKASEKCQELGLVLNQFLLKPKKVKEQEIIDEIGDVIIRLEILKKMFPIEKINERIAYKLSKYTEYKDHDLYKGSI